MARRPPIILPVRDGPDEPIKRQLRRAYRAQTQIGWDQFFHGRIAKAWPKPIGTYYKIRQPGESFTPDEWMRTTIFCWLSTSCGRFLSLRGNNATRN
jgi:hypothetical protein